MASLALPPGGIVGAETANHTPAIKAGQGSRLSSVSAGSRGDARDWLWWSQTATTRQGTALRATTVRPTATSRLSPYSYWQLTKFYEPSIAALPAR